MRKRLSFQLFGFMCVALISGCGDDTASAPSDEAACNPLAPACAPACAAGERCGQDCRCAPEAVCNPDSPLCAPACDAEQVCLDDCTCGDVVDPPVVCDAADPVCDPACAADEFCDGLCVCRPALCDPSQPVCDPGCGPAEVCTPGCQCAPAACDPNEPVCPEGCGEGQRCGSSCVCERACDALNPVCPGGCGDGFCNAECACQGCDPEAPLCDPGCGEGEVCGSQCSCLTAFCDPARPVCDGGCAPGKVCAADCSCVPACSAANPTCIPGCGLNERCNETCECEPTGCDALDPVCDPVCGTGEVCGPFCLCQPEEACNYEQPVCEPGCADGEFCGRDCVCHEVGTELPDLTIVPEMIATTAYTEEKFFDESSCAIAEGCVDGSGFRRLLRFSLMTPNIGTTDLRMGDPESTPELFEYSACHDHYHFDGYAEFRLVNEAGVEVAQGRKVAFCLLDSTRFVESDPGAPQRAQYHCGFQGISQGWADIYGSHLDCQWIDITGVAPGIYTLETAVNPQGFVEELNYDNNYASVAVVVAEPEVTGECISAAQGRGTGRNCAWDLAESHVCTPGEPLSAGCSSGCGLGGCTGDTVMRICPGSDNACLASESIGANDDVCGDTCSLVNFVCPESGAYSVLTGARRVGDEAVCNVQVQGGFVEFSSDVPCGADSQGLNRDCGWSELGSWTCAPGQTVETGCNRECGLGSCSGDTMLRVCPGYGNACLRSDVIANNDDACGSDNVCSHVTFECPDEGVYTVLTASYRSNESSSCSLDATGGAACPTDNLEPNDDPRQPREIELGSFVSLALCQGEQDNYSVFALNVVQATVTTTDPGLVRITVFDSNGETVAQEEGRGVVEIAHDVQVTGRHVISVGLAEGETLTYDLSYTGN